VKSRSSVTTSCTGRLFTGFGAGWLKSVRVRSEICRSPHVKALSTTRARTFARADAVDRTLDSNFFHPERPFALVFEPPPPSLTLTKTSCLKVRARNPPPIGLSRRLTILIVFTDRYFIRSEITSTRARDRARVSRHDVRRFRFRPLRRVRRETLREVSRESSRSRRSRAIDDDSRRNLRKERC